MEAKTCFTSLSDRALLCALTRAAEDEWRSTAGLLRVLAEVDRRALYRAEACSSMFAFMTERLLYSEGAAATRIRAARTAARFPMLFELVEGGDIHLAGIQRLAAHLTEENHKDVLLRARRKSVRDIERLVAELCPKPDIPSSLRKMPERTGSARSAAPDPTSGNVKSSRPGPPGPATLVPLAPAKYSLRVTLGQEAADHCGSCKTCWPTPFPRETRRRSWVALSRGCSAIHMRRRPR
jgi:hypothetical protein